jgi:hypothetical protein
MYTVELAVANMYHTWNTVDIEVEVPQPFDTEEELEGFLFNMAKAQFIQDNPKEEVAFFYLYHYEPGLLDEPGGYFCFFCKQVFPSYDENLPTCPDCGHTIYETPDDAE